MLNIWLVSRIRIKRKGSRFSISRLLGWNEDCFDFFRGLRPPGGFLPHSVVKALGLLGVILKSQAAILDGEEQ